MAFKFETANERWKWFNRKQSDWQDEPATDGSWDRVDKDLEYVDQAVRIQPLLTDINNEFLSPLLAQGRDPIDLVPETAETIYDAALGLVEVLKRWEPEDKDWVLLGPMSESKWADEAKQTLLEISEHIKMVAQAVISDPDVYINDMNANDFFKLVYDFLYMTVVFNRMRNVQVEFKNGD